MLLTISQFICIGTLLVSIVFSFLYALYGLVSKPSVPIKDSYLMILGFLVCRTKDIFEKKGIILGTFRYIFFIIFLFTIPVLVAYSLSAFFPSVEKISEKDGGYIHTHYVAMGTIRLGEESVSVSDKDFYIFNDTDRRFVLIQNLYSAYPMKYGTDRRLEPAEYIPPHSYIKTSHIPAYWFDPPKQISSEYSEASRWVVVARDAN